MKFHLSATFSLITPEETSDAAIAAALEETNDVLALKGQDEDIAAYLSGVLAVAGSGVSSLNEDLLDEAEGLIDDTISAVCEKHFDEFTVTQIDWRLDVVEDDPMELM